MKLMFLLHSLQLGGAERQLTNLATGLARKGHDVSVATFYSRGPFSEDLRSAGVRVLSLEKRGRGDTVGFLYRLVGLARREKPDILHAYMEAANVLTSILKPLLAGMRIVWGMRCSIKDLRYYDRFERAIATLEPKLAAAADLIIVNSHAGAKSAAAQGFPRGKMVVVPNGIETNEFRRDEEARRRLRAELGLSDREFLVGRVGRLHPIKDYPTFLRSAARLHRLHPSVKFLCLGGGSAEETAIVHRLIADLNLRDCVSVLGPRRDVAAVYSALDIFVSSSSAGEGFPNVIAEAMACETPCVVTDTGDSAFVVGTSEHVVPPGSPDALTQACHRILTRSLVWNGKLARQRIVDEFGVDRLVDRTENILLGQVCCAGKSQSPAVPAQRAKSPSFES
jgi:glycosyltransferase involved in cell wall biosynthesis